MRIMILALLVMAFQQQSFKTAHIVGADNYPIENWRIEVIKDSQVIEVFKSAIGGKVTIEIDKYKKYENHKIKVKFDHISLVKKLYKIPSDLRPNNNFYTLKQFIKVKKIILEEK